MSFSNYNSYLRRRVERQECCCPNGNQGGQTGPPGPTGPPGGGGGGTGEGHTGPTGSTGPTGNPFDASGNINMSCHSIIDISYIQFCPGTHVGIDMCGNTIEQVSTVSYKALGSDPHLTGTTTGGDFSIATQNHFVVHTSLVQNALFIKNNGNVGFGAEPPLTGNNILTAYGNVLIGGDLDVSCNDIIDVSNILFCNGAALKGKFRDFSGRIYPGLGPLTDAPVIDCSGILDMSCNSIVDVSGIYFCDGTFINTGGNTGPTGPTGDQGDPGPTGPTGDQGDPGPTGPTGDPGLQGPTGPTGQPGKPGSTGPTGQPGKPGSTGPTGDQGDPGPTGPTGDQGDPGSTGPTGDQGDPGSTGPTGDQGDPGHTGDQGDPGPTGPTGDQGDPGSTGPTGDQGDPGSTGPTGDQGDPGHTGPTGDQGDPGPTGPTGDQGDPGPTGPTGDQGDPGSTGPTGDQGDPGSTGPTGDQGDPGPTGPTGDQGDPGHTGPTGDQGDPGPTGPTGDQGDPGTTGPTGDQGDPGSTGPTGDQGDPGPTGPTGDQGDPGHTGPTGDQGDPGPTGPTGDQGDPGSTGHTGDQGDPGSTGPTGDQGDPGSTGPTGDQGDPGSTGPTGDQGDPGPTGPTGDQGDPGHTGPTGDQGDPGPTGPTGDQGDPGPTGPTGDQGDPGHTGPTGDQGDPGHTGPTGDQGDPGSTGPTGDQGDPGPTGPTGDQGDPGPTGPTGSNPSAGLNAALPYEPYNLDIIDSSGATTGSGSDGNFALIGQGKPIFVQFIAPSTANYTRVTFFKADSQPSNQFSVHLGAAIYSNTEPVSPANGPGTPNLVLGFGELSFSSGAGADLNIYIDIDLSTPAALVAGTRYWVALASAGSIWRSIGKDISYEISKNLVLRNDATLYTAGPVWTNFSGSIIYEDWAYWFRISDPSSSFLVGPQGPTGADPFDASGNLNISCNDIIDVSNIFFCNTDALLGSHKEVTPLGYPGLVTVDSIIPVISCSGELDMLCNSILDVSRVYFCAPGAPVTSGRNWIGTGSSFDISCVETLKMTVPDTSAVEIIVGSSTEMIIDASHVHLTQGTIDTPAIHFGLAGSDTDTGFYRIGADAIGVVGGGKLTASFWNGPSATAGFALPGLTVGVAGVPGLTNNICKIRRMSITPNNSWEDGHLGNSASLIFTPSDFTAYGPYDFAGQGASRINSSNPDPGAGRFAGYYGTVSTTAEIVAQKVVPKGFSIDGSNTITIWTPGGSTINTTCYVSGQAWNQASATGLINLLSSTTFATNTPVTLVGGGTVPALTPLVGDGNKIVTIYWRGFAPLRAGINAPSGASITMNRI